MGMECEANARSGALDELPDTSQKLTASLIANRLRMTVSIHIHEYTRNTENLTRCAVAVEHSRFTHFKTPESCFWLSIVMVEAK